MAQNKRLGYCLAEGKELPRGKFMKSPNTFHKTGLLPFCTDCIQMMEKHYLTKYDNLEYMIFLLCGQCDIPFIREAYNDFETLVAETGRVQNFFILYLDIVTNILKKRYDGQNLRYGFELSDTQTKQFDTRLNPESIDFRALWGEGLSDRQLDYLETRWNAYTDGLDLTPAQEQLYRNLCLAELQIWEGDNVDKALKRQVDMMKILGLDKFTIAQGKSLIEQTIENNILLCEMEEPAEYYEDKGLYKDFRGIHSSWTKEILRPVLNFITGSKDYDITSEDALAWESRADE